MPRIKYSPTPKERKLIEYVSRIYSDWYDGEVFVTPHISFSTRKIIERCRRNYYGIYEQPYDEVDDDEKFWPPLTEHIVESIVKNTDIDTRNFLLYNIGNPDMHGFARVLRLVLMDKMKRMRLGAKLNDLIRRSSIDGGTDIKAVDVWDDERKKWVKDMAVVDSLNMVANPAVDTLDETPSIERAILSPSQFNSYRKWYNKEFVDPQIDLSIGDINDYGRNNRNSSKNYEIFEFWGEAPSYFINDSEKFDESDTTYIHAVLSGLSKSGSSKRVVVHLVEKSKYWDKKTKKPYKEVRFRKVPNRRHGRGAAEALFGAQLYLNLIVNIRRINSKILQNGLFKSKVGSGITQDIVSMLVGGGVIPVNEMTDFEQLVVNDYRPSSYQDEDRIFMWAQRQTFSNEQQKIPSSQAATNSIIQDRNSMRAFDLIQEDFSFPIAEFFEEFIIPELGNEYDDEEILRITGDPMALDEIDRVYVNHLVNKAVSDYIQAEQSIPPSYIVEQERKNAMNKLKRLGPNRHIRIWKDIFSQPVGMEVAITNERIDTALILQNLKEIMAVNSARPDSRWSNDRIIERAIDLMGLNARDFENTIEPVPTTADRVSVKEKRAAGGLTAPNISKSGVLPSNAAASVAPTTQEVANVLTRSSL